MYVSNRHVGWLGDTAGELAPALATSKPVCLLTISSIVQKESLYVFAFLWVGVGRDSRVNHIQPMQSLCD